MSVLPGAVRPLFQRYATPAATATSANSAACAPPGNWGNNMLVKAVIPAAMAGARSRALGQKTSVMASRPPRRHQSRKSREARNNWMRFMAGEASRRFAETALLQMHQQQRDGSGGDARDARRLPQGRG